MPDNGSLLLKDAEAFVTDLFRTKVSETVKFHNLDHTKDVVTACDRLANYYHLPEDERLALMLAAWFHDTGYSSGTAVNHEMVSVELVTDFLTSHDASPELIRKVTGCINATKMPQNPLNSLEKIICDADLFHLGTDAFIEKNRLLREELNTFGKENLSKKDWWRKNVEFLKNHKYFTSFGKEKLEPVKDVFLQSISEKLNAGKKKKKKTKNDIAEVIDDISIVPDLLAIDEKKKKEKDKEKQSERGISTVFRIMAQNQNNLSQMADSKANILISVNAIILSIVISSLVTKLDTNRNLYLPFFLLIAVCVSSIVFSILATRPNVNHGTFTQDDIHNKRTNLLFFGNFYKMGLKDYDWAMLEMLDDKDYLYSSIVKDNYFLGVVLAKKYRFLRIAYNIFMYGLILIVIAFIISQLIPEAGEIYKPG